MTNTINFSKTACERIDFQNWIVTFHKAACKHISLYRMRTIDPFFGIAE